MELGNVIIPDDKEEEIKLEDIVTKVDMEINSNDDYNYVAKLREKKEARGSKNIKEDKHVGEAEIPSNMNMSNLENTFKIDVEGENEEENLNPIKSKEEIVSRQSRQSRQGSETKAKHGLVTIEETVFQKRKKNKKADQPGK
jgi:hypothetical protein